MQQANSPVGCALMKRPASKCSSQDLTIRKKLGLPSDDLLATIEGIYSSLSPVFADLHSVSLVGSAAYGMQTSGSDIDVVLVAKERSLGAVCGFVFDKTIETHQTEKVKPQVEYTALSSSQVEDLFGLASPFAFSMKYGKCLYDDGFLAALYRKPFPTLPGRKYYVQSFFEHIASQYFNTLKALEKATKKRNCNGYCCKMNPECQGLGPAEMFFKLIVRMLYLTLPTHGLMPLTKKDAVDFAKEIYPKEILAAIRKAVQLSRKNSNSIIFTEYKLLKKAAVHLFREILTFLGPQNDVRHVLHDAASAVRGDFHRIQSSSLKNCFV